MEKARWLGRSGTQKLNAEREKSEGFGEVLLWLSFLVLNGEEKIHVCAWGLGVCASFGGD